MQGNEEEIPLQTCLPQQLIPRPLDVKIQCPLASRLKNVLVEHRACVKAL